MHIHRFFVTSDLSEGDEIPLEGDDSFHAARVLRLGPGDAIELADGRGMVFSSVITSTDEVVRARVECLSEEASGGDRNDRAEPGTGAGYTVAQALPAGRKMDLVVEKLSELGIGTLVPVVTANSVSSGKVGSERRSRWDRIARSAAAQSHRTAAMQVAEPVELEQWLRLSDKPPIVLATETGTRPLGEVVDEVSGDISLLVGPEAGFTAEEIGALRESGALFAGLGSRLLRTETAAFVAASIIMHRRGQLG